MEYKIISSRVLSESSRVKLSKSHATSLNWQGFMNEIKLYRIFRKGFVTAHKDQYRMMFVIDFFKKKNLNKKGSITCVDVVGQFFILLFLSHLLFPDLPDSSATF